MHTEKNVQNRSNKMQAYLDNSATTRCSERAKDLMVKVLMEDYGNPSSLHTMGVVAERYIKEAKERIAKTLKVDEKEILFTSGGTESNNMALIGTALANKRAGKHIITTSIEHASVLSPLAYLEEQGFRVTYLTVDENGQISLDELRDAVCEDTILVSMMMVNNEIGAVEPIAEAAKIVSESIMTTALDKIQHNLPADVLRMAFNAADSAIYGKCRDLKCKMGAAVTVALVIDDSLYYAWQGNVRLYKVHANEVMLLTTDHVVADADGTFLTRCVNGKGFRENIPVIYEELKNTDKIFICSDGYYRHVHLTELSRNVTVNFKEGASDDYSLIEIYFT